jgi:hypothetical protein
MQVTDDGAAIDDIIEAVQDAIKIAGISSTDDDRDLRITSVQLVLHTVASRTAGGGADFRIPFLGMTFKVGGSVTRQDTHTLDLTLVPPEPGQLPEVRDDDVAAVLAESISTIRGVLALASGGDDPFGLQAATVELNFAVTRDGSITVGFNGELHGQVSHTLRAGIESARLREACRDEQGHWQAAGEVRHQRSRSGVLRTGKHVYPAGVGQRKDGA